MLVNSFFSSLMSLKCKVLSPIIYFLSSSFTIPPFHSKLLQTKLEPILFIFSTQLKIKLYNFTASKYEILWIMLFMNHKLLSICLLWYPRSSTNNKAQMILHRVCPPILIKLLICTLHKQISSLAFVTPDVPMHS